MAKKRGGSSQGTGSKFTGTGSSKSKVDSGKREALDLADSKQTETTTSQLDDSKTASTSRAGFRSSEQVTQFDMSDGTGNKGKSLNDLLDESRTPTPQRTDSKIKSGQPKSSPKAKMSSASKGKDQESSSSSRKQGVDVTILWRDDILTSRFFTKSQKITLGPKGTFPMPEEVVGGQNQVLVEPTGAGNFGLRIDNPKASGQLIVSGKSHDIPDLRAGKIAGLKGPIVPLTTTTKATLVYDEFTFIVKRLPVSTPRKFSLFSRDMLPILLSFIISSLLTIVPITVAYSLADLRGLTKLSYKEKLDRRIAQLEFIEIQKEEPPPELEEKKEEKEEPKPIKVEEPEKKEEQKIKKQVTQLEKDLNKLTEEERKEKVVAMVDKQVQAATADVDKALADMNNQLMGTRLFAEGDDGEGDIENPSGDSGNVLADPEGLTAGKVLTVKSGAASDTMGGKAATQRASIKGLGKDKNAGKNVDIAIKKRTQKVVRVGGGRGSKSRGELPKKVIRRYIATKMGAIKACYQKGLQANPSLQGKVKVKFLIKPTGSVAGVKIANSSLNSPAVESCLMRNIKTWRFPRAKSGGSTMVIYPFNFRSR